MQCFKTVGSLQSQLSSLREKGQSVALVPTMGSLHEGHLDLVSAARATGAAVVVSIFVNPLQFGPSEDFTAYPRDLERDTRLLEQEGTWGAFIPETSEILGVNPVVTIDPGPMATMLCGQYRPGHFAGVCTIVAKLFNIVRPDLAFFGWKDAQQFVILQQMVHDLSYPIKMHGVETRRESDGLAQSSRNVYLSQDERKTAPILQETLRHLREKWETGEFKNSDELKHYGMEILQKAGFRPQYVSLVSLRNFEPLSAPNPGNSLLAAAAYLGKTRLIDNIRF